MSLETNPTARVSSTFGSRTLWLFSILCLVTVALASRSLQAQIRLEDNEQAQSDPREIIVILVQGNEKTKEEVILREMKLKVGEQFDPAELEQDRLRIQNLGIFNRVEIDLVPTQRGVILIVTVSEMWYVFPYPIIFRNERNWSRLSVGAGLLYTNFRGRREVIDLAFWLGFNPSVRLAYSNPWIMGNLKLYTSFSVFAKKVRNQTFTVLDSSVNENQIGFNWKIGKRFGHFTYLDVNVGYRRLTLSDNSAGTLSPSGIDHLPQAGISFKYDTRDLWEYAHKGHYVRLWATQTGWFGRTVDYLRFGADVRKYLPIGPTTLALHADANISHGDLPVYDLVHFGFLTRIRGHFSERRTGENAFVGSAEFRFPIRKITYHNWGPFQSMGRYGSNFRFGISGGLFVDTGSLWRQGEEPGDFITGWGAGLHIFLPYNNILRLEYAFDEDWNGQVIIDALMTF